MTDAPEAPPAPGAADVSRVPTVPTAPSAPTALAVPAVAAAPGDHDPATGGVAGSPSGGAAGLGSSCDPLLAELRQELGAALVAECRSLDLTIEVRRHDMALAAAVLRSRFRYTLLADLCAADYPRRPARFEVIYHLYSFRENRRLRVKVRTDASSLVPSVAAIWRGADWLEREAHDLFGIAFSGRPALLPLLLWEGFAGHPLRKDFPLAGIATGAAAAGPAPSPAVAALPAPPALLPPGGTPA